MTEDTQTTEAPKRPKKLEKTSKGTVVILKENTSGTELTFDVAQWPQEIQQNLMIHGALQKLGDSAAGKSGQEAVDSINKVAEGLAKGDWTIRAPAAPKVTKKDIANNLDAMSDKDRAAAQALLQKLGIKV